MPVVGISIDGLIRLLGKSLEREKLIAHLGEVGCDVKGYERVALHKCPKCDEVLETAPKEELPKECPGCGLDFAEETVSLVQVGESEVVRMELLPDRPDLFDVGGLARALRGYLGYEVGLATYEISSSGYSVSVDEKLSSESSFRPYIACAVVLGLSLDSELTRTLMKLQENLHWALGRDRKKASIGVYDLATVKPNFSYRAVEKDGPKFVPLGGMPGSESEPVTPEEILSKHPKGVAYRGLLEGFQRYPLLTDSENAVLSMPPIINSEKTRVTQGTQDLLIDVTGPDKSSVGKALNVLVCSLAELGGRIESVTIDYPGGSEVTPDLSPGALMLSPSTASELIGVEIPPQDMLELLRRMRYETTLHGGDLKVTVPAYRADVMHEVDLIEDVAIAYGYHNIEPSLVPTLTVGEEAELERFSSMVRTAMTGMGFHEVMSLMLTNPDAHYSMLNLDEGSDCVKVENPASLEQSMLRTHIFSSLLETFRLSRTQSMPQRVFEIGDVSVLDEAAETGAKDLRKVAAGIMDPKTGFAEIKSVVEALARELGLTVRLEPEESPMFIEGRCAVVITEGHVGTGLVGAQRKSRLGGAPVRDGGENVGTGFTPVRGGGREGNVGLIGEVHPQVLENFEIVQPVSMFELNVNSIMVV